MGAGGVEDVTPGRFVGDVSLAATTITKTRSTTKAMAAGGKEMMTPMMCKF